MNDRKSQPWKELEEGSPRRRATADAKALWWERIELFGKGKKVVVAAARQAREEKGETESQSWTRAGA